MLGLYAGFIKQNINFQRYILVTPSNIDHYCGGITRANIPKLWLTIIYEIKTHKYNILDNMLKDSFYLQWPDDFAYPIPICRKYD